MKANDPMQTYIKCRPILALLLSVILAAVFLAACSEGIDPVEEQANEPDLSRFLVTVEDNPDTVDFQCTSIHYTVALNAFNRLVETEMDMEGNLKLMPSLAKSWEMSDDGLVYTFHLRDGVTFSNGSKLTASDVAYTFERLLTHPDSCNKDIAEPILGAAKLENGEADTLEGFQILGDLDFSITLAEPFEPFLSCISMPGGSILDEETTKEAGDRFGKDPEHTIGTGPFVLWKWEPNVGMLLKANPDCWEGAPGCEGLDLRFLTEAEDIKELYESGELDIMALDDIGNAAEFYIHGDIYQDLLYHFQELGISYIALNESVAPLNNPQVRKALQLALNRKTLLGAVYSGRGNVEHGIFPHGLYGSNPDLPEIPFDQQAAANLLRDAGFPNGFDLTVYVKSSSTQNEMTMLTLAASMWEKIGVRTTLEIIDDTEFMTLRKNGELPCYTATWTADFDDPDNFIYTFFGNTANTTFRSLCYPKEEVMEQVRVARTITDPDKRLKTYHKLEKTIIQDDAAWIPLYSRQRFFVISDRVVGFQAAWNGAVKNRYKYYSLKEG